MRTHWHDRWDENRIGFHVDAVNEHLVRFVSRLPTGRILVPLSGKSLDLWFLAERGYEPTGVELVPRAVEQFFAEASITPSRTRERGTTVYLGGGVRVMLANFFEVTDGPFDAAWDRAALIAVEPPRREAYVAQLSRQLRPGAPLLLVTLDYDPSRMEGPPFVLTDDQVTTLFHPGFVGERLHRGAATLPPRAAELGLTAEESVWLLTKRE